MITYAEMKAALERAVEERGADFVYPEEWRGTQIRRNTERHLCRYRLPDGRPGCIIGLAMSYLMPDVVLPEFTGAEEALEFLAEDAAINLAMVVQSEQDESASWGHALHIGLEMVKEPRA